MENRRDYLIVDLSKEEKKYLIRIAVSTRNKYIRDNYDYLNIKTVELKDNIPSNDTFVLETIINKCEEKIKTVDQFEQLITDKRLYKSVRALSLKEKIVLFSLYIQNKTINQTAQEMGIARQTVWRTEKRAIRKLLKYMLGGK